MAAPEKTSFSGLIISIQPRIRLMRSFDQRNHAYLGYVLLVRGSGGSAKRDVLVAIGAATQAEHRLRGGDSISGRALPVSEPHTEIADLYKVSGLEVLERGAFAAVSGPPWQDVPPPLPIYRERGHRRLDAKTTRASAPRACGGAGCRGDDRRPVEAEGQAISGGDVLLRAPFLLGLPSGFPANRPRSQRDDLGGGRLGRR